MLLAVDIGNTNISFGVFKGAGLKKTFDIPTKKYSRNKLLEKIISLKVTDTLISSVVPGITRVIAKDISGITGKRPYIIGKDIKVPIKNLYRRPNQVGQDRLVNAYAAAKLYGAPLVVVDFGTAITFDVISKSGAYEGGLILPGLRLAIDALNRQTALLPKIRISRPKEFIGKDTRSSILSGMVYGFSGMAEQLNNRIKKRLGTQARVITTGGNAALMRRYCNNIDRFDSALTLKGINLIYRNFK
ncbi:MAG: type III pantothenate kinase [Candidatus Omnitrophota bacterium]